MRAFRIIMLCVLAVIGSGIAWCTIAYPAHTYRYRMTVEVMVGGVVRSGSSVIEVTVQKQPQIGDAPAQISRVRGEAVFVDLDNGQNVIALLAAGPRATNLDYSYNVVPTLFHLTSDDAKLPRLRGTREVPLNYLPTFITLSDLNDPHTAREVHPNEFGRVFGANVRLHRVIVEVPSDTATHGIEHKLPWLSHTERYRTNPDNPFTNTLTFGRNLFVSGF